MIQFRDVRFDCALYNGYKPCRYGNECAACPHYEPLALPPGAGDYQPKPQPAVHGHARVLIIKTGAMGDVLRTTTLLPAIKRQWPDSHITWVTAHNARSLLVANPYVNELLALDAAIAKRVAAQEFDVLLNFEKEQEPLRLAGAVRARRKLGYAPTPWNTPTVFNPESEYALLLGINDDLKFRLNSKSYPAIIAEMAALPYLRDEYVLGLTDASHRRRSKVEQLIPPGTGRLRIGLNTGCGNVFRTKQWPLENWVELIHAIQSRMDAYILLMGGSAERELNAAILSQTTGVIDTGTENPLEDFFGVIDACDLVVTSDTLGMHIAIALQKYVVALFGSTSHVEIDLYARGEKVITDFPCSPCYLKTCSLDPMCMQAMRGNHVAEAVIRGIEKLRPQLAAHAK